MKLKIAPLPRMDSDVFPDEASILKSSLYAMVGALAYIATTVQFTLAPSRNTREATHAIVDADVG